MIGVAEAIVIAALLVVFGPVLVYLVAAALLLVAVALEDYGVLP
jgi:hypothetical protein